MWFATLNMMLGKEADLRYFRSQQRVNVEGVGINFLHAVRRKSLSTADNDIK